MSPPDSSLPAQPPRLPLWLVTTLLPRAEAKEVRADLSAEFGRRAARDGRPAARGWLWRQALHSTPFLLRWGWWRQWSDYEPRSSAFNPRHPRLMHWFSDIRYATRRLVSRPAYSLLAILTLALGVGGTAAVFGVARPLLVDELPYANAAKLGMFWMGGWWTEEEMLFLRGKYPGFSAVGGYRPRDVTLRDGDAPGRLVPGLQVTAELFDVLGARPILGRSFQPGDDAQGSPRVAIISYGLFQELGGNPSLIGKPMMLNGVSQTIVGVMPRRFWFPSPDVRIWHVSPLDPQGRNGSYSLVGLPMNGVDVHQMDGPVTRLVAMMRERFEYSKSGDKLDDPKIIPLRDSLFGPMRPAVIATFISMSLILLIACTNVAALMLGQIEGRSTELAVRAALGATRGRITQQLVFEAALIGLAAAVVGGVLAASGFHLLARALPIGAWSDTATFDWSLFAAALAISLLAVLLVVFVPAISLWRRDLRDALNRVRTGGVQGRGHRLEHGLVVAEMTLAMLIATGAGLLVRSVAKRYAINPGVNVTGVAVVDVTAGPELTNRERRLKIDAVVEALSHLPGVKSAGAAMKLPLRGGGDSFGITVVGQEHPERPTTYFRIGTLNYFATMGYRVKSGRLFTSADFTDTTRFPVVVNEALVAKYFPGENPIGRVLGGGFNTPQTIIGVVSDAAEADLKTEGEPTRYYLAGSAPWFGQNGAFVVRTTRPEDAERVIDEARRVVQRVAPGFGIQGTSTMQRVLDVAIGPVRQVMSLLTLLSTLALVLGAVGIYGVISHFASRRQRDWAIRVALGLPGSGVVRHIVSQGITLALIGVAIGGVIAAVSGRLLSSFLYGVNAIDAASFLGAGTLLVLIGAAAAFFPARRAGTVDPALVLREQ